MALDAEALKAHLNMTADDADALDATALPAIIEAAKAHCESILGYKLDDTTEHPEGPPADLVQAVLMLAAHWYQQRGAVLIGVTGSEVPFGVAQILGEHRSYTFG